MKNLLISLIFFVIFHSVFSIKDTAGFRDLLSALDRNPSDFIDILTARDYGDRFPSFLNCPNIYLSNGRSKLRSNGRVIRFNCKSGYQLLGKQFSTCIRGRWNTPIPVCVDKGCRELRPPTNGMMRKVDREGAVYTFGCEPGYRLNGSMGVFCNRLLWNATVPQCIPELTNANLSCDFETPDLCNWRHETRRDNFDWSVTSFKTPSGFWKTGPSYDHTLGENRNGKYMYIEASSPRKENDNAILVSPVYNLDGNVNNFNDVMCVQLWYHMYGSSTGSLKVHLKQEGIYTQLWNASGNHGDQWLLAVVTIDNMNPSKTFQIAIEAVRGSGYDGDIGIDDFSIQFGDNCTVVEIETEATWTTNSMYSTDYATDLSTSSIDDALTVENEDLTTIGELTTKQMELPTSAIELATSPPPKIIPIQMTTTVQTSTTLTEITTPIIIATGKPTLTSTGMSITLPVTTNPTTTTFKPITTTINPTTNPPTTTTKPTTTTTKPTTTTTKPTTTTTKPTTTTAKSTTTIRLTTNTVKPTTTTIKPTTTTIKPTTTTIIPTTTNIKPTTTTIKPTTTTIKPTTTTIKPITTTIKLTTTIKPTITTAKPPTTSTIKWTTSTKITTPKSTNVPLKATTKKFTPTTPKSYTKPTWTKKPIVVYTKIYTKPTTRKSTSTTPATSTSQVWTTTVDVGRKPVLPPWVYLSTVKTIDVDDLDNDLKPMAHTADGSVGVPAAIAIAVVTVAVLLMALVFHVYRKHVKRQKENLHEDSDVRFLKDGEMHVEFIDHDIMQPMSFT